MTIQRVMIVDDSPTEIYYLSEILVGNGYDVISASNGIEALEKARREIPDLILMDVVMPNMNGYQATRELAKIAETSKIPVVFCTTKGEEADKVWGLRQGAADYLVKPIHPEDLLGLISSMA